MTWTATGSFLFKDTGSLTMSNQGIGDLMLLEVDNYSNSTVHCTGITGGGCTWTSVVTFNGTHNANSHTLFMGTVTATGAQTATPTWSGTMPGFEINGHEFISSVGSWSVDTTGTLDVTTGTASWTSLTPAKSGELYFGFASNSATGIAGSTSGYTYNINTEGDATAYNLSCPAGVGTFPVWGNAEALIGIMALIQETPSASAGPTYSIIFSQRVATVPFRSGPNR